MLKIVEHNQDAIELHFDGLYNDQFILTFDYWFLKNLNVDLDNLYDKSLKNKTSFIEELCGVNKNALLGLKNFNYKAITVFKNNQIVHEMSQQYSTGV